MDGIFDATRRRSLLVDVNANTNLIVKPATPARLAFDVTNNHEIVIRHYFQASSSFNVVNVRPPIAWINPGQTINVVVELFVPDGPRDRGTNGDGTLTLRVQGIGIAQKTTYLYVQGESTALVTDTEKPAISYSFNDNCAGRQGTDRCAKSFWSVDVTVRDADSGLKRVVSTPNGIYPLTNFISGTRSDVTFYYLATCCSTSVAITASDVLGNYHSRTIDVTEWDNLSQGEVAAIVLGALLILLLIILIVLIVLYCARRKESLDLTFTRRYGSRSSPRAEGTNF
ncbi:uncharacterized protein LOC105700348 [Orussus abietinus]|uniref:uncharacterized protein LOC105700348 n=1 Tax=Orussus abietinus TaxID=222816 RepID=UPI000C715D84|nr:uncharacterized protein LOC105700348 [Orussus abietinus]XP_023287923.1 uncharacterized protein LOC105700348 [Orussus abietinus]